MATRATLDDRLRTSRCWSNYLGRQPQLPLSSMGVPKFDVFPNEEADIWSPYTDSGLGEAHSQPSRTRAIALQISALCEISCDLLSFFYNHTRLEKPPSKQAELGKLSDLHTRLEAWRKGIPKEMEPREGQLPNILVMQYIPILACQGEREWLTVSQHVLSVTLYPSIPSVSEIHES